MSGPGGAEDGLDAVLGRMAEVCADPRGFTIGDLQAKTGGRAWLVLLLLLPLPFISPIPLPGLSTPFGIAIACVGVAVLRGRDPVIPGRIGRLRCPPGLVARAMAATTRQMARLRSLVRPRWGWLAERAWSRRAAGAVIAVSGVLLALPLPVPGSNALPAYAILLTGLGLAQRDGLVLLAGQALFLLTAAAFAALGWAARAGWSALA